MQHFSQDYIDFFAELEENNHKEWFDANKKRYEKSIKKPFFDFTQHMINLIKEDDAEIDTDAKNSIFRINRDVRFSQDKSPYKIMSSAAISKYGRKNLVMPGIYFEIRSNEINIYGGVHAPEKEHLQMIREYIADHLDKFKTAYGDKNFVSHFDKILGEKNKKVPADFKEAATVEPLILNKQFYYCARIDGQEITNPKLDQILMEKYYAGKVMQNFLKKALGF